MIILLNLEKSFNLNKFVTTYISFLSTKTGADPGFLEEGFRSIKRGFVFNLLPDFFHKFPHELEII